METRDTYRDPWGERTPRNKRFIWTEADFLLLEHHGIFGKLPSFYTHQGTKHLRKDWTQHSNRLTDFWHGSLEQGAFLEREYSQTYQKHPYSKYMVSHLAPNAKRLLASVDRLPRNLAPTTNSFVHDLMQACVLYSLFLTAPDRDHTFIPRDGVLEYKAGPANKAKRPLAIPLPGRDSRGRERHLIPDDLFALERTDGKRRVYILEIDRDTESDTSKNPYANTWEKKVANYETMYRDKLHAKWWGFPVAKVLTVTTNDRSLEAKRDYVREFSRFPDRYEFAVEPLFGGRWSTPSEILRTIDQLAL